MKKLFFFSILFLSLQVSFAQVKYKKWSDINTTRFGNEVIYTDKDDQPLNGDYKLSERSGAFNEMSFINGKPNGKTKIYDSFNNLILEGAYKDGLPHGKITEYFQNGNIQKESNFIDGKKDGTWKEFDKKGEVRVVENYKNDKKDGKWTQRLKNAETGEMFTETKFYKTGIATGKWTSITDDGVTMWEKDYKNNSDYTKKEYYPNAKLRSLEIFLDYKKNGICEYYNQNGILLYKSHYNAGYPTKKEIYFENGVLKEVFNYKNGFKDGKYTYFDELGTLQVEGSYKTDYRDGLWIYYNDDGSKAKTFNYKNDVKDGLSQTFNEAGTIEREGQYKNDQKQGLWKVYKLNGNLKKEIEYKNDNIITEKEYK
ncbi:MAG: hypothetical protein CR968_01430 [Flavobacteriia bacterium]|nr:MAG: hypothetical protein CR968_01430 [Flavobacteriia bacterium]